LPARERLVLEGVEQTEDGIIIIRVRGKMKPQCPVCFGRRVSYHDQYQRELRDLSGQGEPVRIRLRLRCFRCRNQGCHRKFSPSVCRAWWLPGREKRSTRVRCFVGSGMPWADCRDGDC